MNKLLKDQNTTITIPKTWPHRLAGVGKVIVAQYAEVLDNQKTIGVKISQLLAGAAICLLAGALFVASYGKNLDFLFALLAGIGIGAAIMFLRVCYQVSRLSQ